MTHEEAKAIYHSPILWGNTFIEYEDAKARCKEAEELSKGLSLVRTETRTWYEDTYEVAVPDYAGVAMLIERIRASLAQPKDVERVTGRSRQCDDPECGNGYGCICYTR